MGKRARPRAIEVGVPVPLPDPRPFVPHIRLPGSRETAFVALHSGVTGFLMHWVNNQHLPHCRDREWCAGCRLGQSPRWTGYVGVLSLNTLNRFVLSIPPAAFRESGNFRDRSDANMLTGLVFTSYRFGSTRSANNPAVIEVIKPSVPTPLAKPFPLLAALARYWRMETLDALDVVKRPEDADAKLAAEYAEFAKKVNAERHEGKGGKP